MSKKILPRKSVIVVTCLLVILECFIISLVYKRNLEQNKVILKNDLLENNNSIFAIMIGQNGDYVISDEYPTEDKYIFNKEKSGCLDLDGNLIEGSLDYDKVTKKVSADLAYSSYCYLYFDLDETAPQIFTFYLGGSANPTYANNINNNVYLSWSDTDIANYCVTNTEGVGSCTWHSVNGNSITTSHTLDSTNGTKTVYAYLKDKAGNVSPVVSDTVILDTVAPTIDTLTKSTGSTSSITAAITFTEATSGIESYYYKIGTGPYTASASTSYQFTGLSSGTTYSISVYAVDKAGNVGTVKTASLKTSSPIIIIRPT